MANPHQLVIDRMAEQLDNLVERFGDERGDEDAFNGDDDNRAEMEALRGGVRALRAAAPPVFNRADFEDMIDAIRPDGADGGDGAGNRLGKPKLEKLTKKDADSWRAWKTHVILVTQENEWDQVSHDRPKRMIKMNLFDAAERITRDIMPIPAAERAALGEDEETYMDFLNKLQLRFLPVSGQFKAQTDFENAKQRSDQTIGEYHADLISKFTEAFPDAPDPYTDPHLLRRFYQGLRDQAVQAWVMQMQPDNYHDSLKEAEARYAVLSTLQSTRRAGGGTINSLDSLGGQEGKDLSQQVAKKVLAALDKRMQTSGAEANRQLRSGQWEGAPKKMDGDRKCFICQSPYHLKRDCPTPLLSAGRAGGSGGQQGAPVDVNALSPRKREKRGRIRKRSARIAAQIKELAAVAGNDGDDAGSKLLSILMKDLGQEDQEGGDQQ